MGIFKEECYGLQCDNCGEIYESIEGNTIFPDRYALYNDIQRVDKGWKKIDGKWYCPDCVNELFIQDEETGEYKLKE